MNNYEKRCGFGLPHLNAEMQKRLPKKYAHYLTDVPDNRKLTLAVLFDNLEKSLDATFICDPETKNAKQDHKRKKEYLFERTKLMFDVLKFPRFTKLQPMSSPVSFAFAIRYQYGSLDAKSPSPKEMITYSELKERLDAIDTLAPWKITDELREYGFASRQQLLDELYKEFIREAMVNNAATKSEDMWLEFTNETNYDEEIEAHFEAKKPVQVNTCGMPMSSFRIEKGVVEAKSIKHDTLEELIYELDQMFVESIFQALEIASIEPMTVKKSEFEERLKTQILIASQKVAIATRRGPGNVVLMPESLREHARGGFGVELFQDIVFLPDELMKGHIILTYIGPTVYDAGIIACPFILYDRAESTPPSIKDTPLKKLLVSKDSLEKQVSHRARMGVLSNLFRTAQYFQHIKIEDD